MCDHLAFVLYPNIFFLFSRRVRKTALGELHTSSKRFKKKKKILSYPVERDFKGIPHPQGGGVFNFYDHRLEKEEDDDIVCVVLGI